MNDNTWLYRQIHPSAVRNGRVEIAQFKPKGRDDGQLSVYDGDRFTPEQAWLHFTSQRNQSGSYNESAGVLGFTVKECRDLDVEPKPDPSAFVGHVQIDYSDCENKTKVARELRKAAWARGWCYEGDE